MIQLYFVSQDRPVSWGNKSVPFNSLYIYKHETKSGLFSCLLPLMCMHSFTAPGDSIVPPPEKKEVSAPLGCRGTRSFSHDITRSCFERYHTTIVLTCGVLTSKANFKCDIRSQAYSLSTVYHHRWFALFSRPPSTVFALGSLDPDSLFQLHVVNLPQTFSVPRPAVLSSAQRVVS